jgi:hypothetical protein
MPAKLGSASFLGQSGKLIGLLDLRTGRAVDFVPTLTSRVSGVPGGDASQWEYSGGKPEFGGSARWGVTPNLTLNAAANPDFAEVESDASQFSFDPRQAVSFAERRPFFLDGIEQFQVPRNLVYTRRIIQPVVAAKLTGRAAGMRVGVLAAVDDKIGSRHGENPIFGIVRLMRDFNGGSQLGMVHTEQHDGPDNNRVTGVDGRVVVGRIHSATFSGAIANDHLSGETTSAPVWNLGYRMNGRNFRVRSGVAGVHEDFRTRSGFISRAGVANASLAPSYTWLRTGRTIESISAEVLVDGTWHYDSLVHGGGIQDRKLHFNFNTQWKGGWTAGASVLVEDFGYDPKLYSDYALLNTDGSLSPFVGVARIPNRDYIISVSSPAFPLGQFGGFVLWGHDENFAEWASADIVWIEADMTLTPSEQFRLNFSYNHTQVNRRDDGSRVTLQMVPRARIEYQLSRALQVRVIAQYALHEQDVLRDNSRTELPIVFITGPNGQYTTDTGFRDGKLRGDVLLSYVPNPGTVIYLGYGSSHSEPLISGRRQLQKTNDAFFLKLSYLFRMQG